MIIGGNWQMNSVNFHETPPPLVPRQFQGSMFHQNLLEVKSHDTFANCYQISRIFMKNGPNRYHENLRSFVNDHQTLSYTIFNSVSYHFNKRKNTGWLGRCFKFRLKWHFFLCVCLIPSAKWSPEESFNSAVNKGPSNVIILPQYLCHKHYM